MYTGQTNLTERISLHTEYQHRELDVRMAPEQRLLRTGLNYHFSETGLAGAGYAYILHRDDLLNGKNGFPWVNEHRMWQQFQYRVQFAPFMLDNRYRFEQRWMEQGFNPRMRYRLTVQAPFNRPKVEQGAVFLSMYNEIFLDFDDQPFDRNRLYGAIGYQFHPDLNLQLGWMRQSLADSKHDYLQVGLMMRNRLFN
jgi:hypothetical protein